MTAEFSSDAYPCRGDVHSEVHYTLWVGDIAMNVCILLTCPGRASRSNRWSSFVLGTDAPCGEGR